MTIEYLTIPNGHFCSIFTVNAMNARRSALGQMKYIQLIIP